MIVSVFHMNVSALMFGLVFLCVLLSASAESPPLGPPATAYRETVTLPSVLSFGFFAGTAVREPTQEEVDGLLVQTTRFYSDLFSTHYDPRIVEDDVTLDVTQATLDAPNSQFPVRIDFSTSATFVVETADSDAVPTEQELGDLMQGADYNTFIQNFVWTADPPDGLFYDVQRVVFDYDAPDPDVPSEAPTGVETYYPTFSPTYVPWSVGLELRMAFGLFDDGTVRVPTPDEMDAWKQATHDFFLAHLQSKYPGHCHDGEEYCHEFIERMTIHVRDTFLDESSPLSSTHPIVIHLSARIEMNTGISMDAMPTREQLYADLNCVDFEDYMENHVRTSGPKDGIFSLAQRVKLFRRNGDTAYQPITSPCGPTVAPTVPPSEVPTDYGPTYIPITTAPTRHPEHVRLVTVKATMEFGLDQNASIREPTPQESIAVMNQTSRFFTKHLTAMYPNRLDAFQAKFVKSYLLEETNSLYPIRIEFDAQAFFVEEALVPSELDLFEKMDSADFDNDYINNYLSNSPAETGMFHKTQRVDFNRRHQFSERDKWVYSVDPTTDSLYILDSATGKNVKTILTLDGYRAPVGMAESGGFLYVFNNAPTSLLKIDPGSLEVTQISTGGSNALCLAFGNGKLYTKLENSRDLVALDLETGEPTIVCPKIFPSSEVGGLEIDPHNGLLYGVQAYNSDSARMYTIDPVQCSFTRICTMELTGVNGGLNSLVWNPTTDMFLASLDPNLIFDLDIDCTITNVRQTEGPSPSGMAMYFDPVEPSPAPSPTTSGAPSLTYGPTTSGAPSLTYGPTASGAPSLTYEPTATDAPSLTDEPTPGYPTITCYDFWGDGEVLDGKCYAVDISFCTEVSATCTFVESFYEYYNQYTTDVGSTRETYAYVSVLAAYDCVDRPDECSINVAGVNCNECTNDGLAVTMVDCTNIPEGVMEGTFAPAPQTISLSEGGGSFDLIATENMCNHPSVVAVADRSFVKMATKDTSVSDYSFFVPSELHFQFAEGKGGDLDFDALAHLMTKTLAFFNTVLPGALDSALLGNIEIDDIYTDYDETAPDSLVVFFNTNIDLKSSSTMTSRNVVHAMATADWNKYVDHYVHQQKGPHAAMNSILDGVSLVIFRGIGRESP